MTTHIPELQAIWARFREYGVPDADLHELVTLAQDMEADRIAAVIGQMLEHPRMEQARDTPGKLAARTVLEVLSKAIADRAYRPGSAGG